MVVRFAQAGQAGRAQEFLDGAARPHATVGVPVASTLQSHLLKTPSLCGHVVGIHDSAGRVFYKGK